MFVLSTCTCDGSVVCSCFKVHPRRDRQTERVSRFPCFHPSLPVRYTFLSGHLVSREQLQFVVCALISVCVCVCVCVCRLRKKFGNDWATIGAALGRSASSVKDRCRLMKDTCNTGRTRTHAQAICSFTFLFPASLNWHEKLYWSAVVLVIFRVLTV